MLAIVGAAAVKVCKIMGSTVPVIKVNTSCMIGLTVPVAKVTICPTTPMMDCRIVTTPPNAAPAFSPNRFVIVFCKGASAAATPPSLKSPVTKSATPCSLPVNTSNTCPPVSPNTFTTMPRMSSKWSPKMLTTAIMPLIAAITGAAPANRLPKPPATGPQTLPSSPAPAPAKLPSAPKALEPTLTTPFATPPTLPAAPPIACPTPLFATVEITFPALPATQPAPFCASPLAPLTRFVRPKPSGPAMPARISLLTPMVPLLKPTILLPMVVFATFPAAARIPPKYCPIGLLVTAFFAIPSSPPPCFASVICPATPIRPCINL